MVDGYRNLDEIFLLIASSTNMDYSPLDLSDAQQIVARAPVDRIFHWSGQRWQKIAQLPLAGDRND